MSDFAVVRDGRTLIAAGNSLAEALSRAAKTFYAGQVPPTLVIVEYGTDPLPSLAALPCSPGVLAVSDAVLSHGAITLYEGSLWLVDEMGEIYEEQLPLF